MLLYTVEISLFFIVCLTTQPLNSIAEDSNKIEDFDPLTVNLDPDEISPVFSFRLPTSLKPLEYLIKIYPIPLEERERFRGFVLIELVVVEETRMITLNMAELNLERNSIEVTLYGVNGRKIVKLTDELFDQENELATFVMETPASVGDVIRFSCFYSGLLVTDSYGLNQFFYEEDGAQKRFLATYFQAVGARRVFPCMDEPKLKAQFTLHIASPKEEFVLSNMPVNKTIQQGNSSYIWTIFEKSLPMSTYLVAFLISDFETDNTLTPQITKVWSRKSMQKQSSYAFSLAPKVLRWYERYFEVWYPLSKLDLVTLPSYPVPGMENFGLIFSHEDSLTTNEKISRKEWVATVTAHEIAHQWIGNLVTPLSWSEYWLSEGFATYFAARALDEIEPELEATYQMMAENVRLILVQDEEDRASNLVVKLFDPLKGSGRNIEIYYKGAAVLRMLNSALGEELFSKGIKKYFNKYKFSSVSEEDFYTVLSEEISSSNKILPTSLSKIMETWVTQKGFPLITAKRLLNGTITVRQDYFKNPSTSSKFLGSISSGPTDSNLTWWVPISYFTSRNPDFSMTPKIWLPPSNESMILEGVTSDDHWVVINSQQSSYLRVNYDKGLWKAISDQLLLDHHKIHVLNRAQLFEDSFHLFNSGYLDAEQPLDLMRYLSKEMNFIPFKAAFRSFSEIEIVMRGRIQYPLLKKFLSSIISPLLKIGFGRNHAEIKRYRLALSWACKFQSPNCTEVAHKLFGKWKINNNIDIFPEGAVDSLLCAAIESGTADDWTIAFERSFSTSGFEGKETVRNALSCSRNETAIVKYMNFVISGDHNLTFDDAKNIFDNLVRSVRWNHLTWTFFYQKIKDLKQRFDGMLPVPFVSTSYDYHYFSEIIKDALSVEKSENVTPFIEEGKRFAASAAKTISQVSDWLVKHAPFRAFR